VEGLCDSTVQGNMTQKEYFASGTEPKENCDCHIKFSVCQESNANAGNYCPNEDVTTAVYLKAGTEGTEDAKAVVPENIGESCEVHKNFWNQWFEEPSKPEESEGGWWEKFFRNWF
jgi:penicillin-binding protein 1A